MTRVGIYGRVSKKDQEVLNQVAELRRVASEKSWTVVDEYLDVGVKGDEPKPELERLLRDAHVGKVDLVSFWALDRLTRAGALDALQVLDRLAKQGVSYWSYKEPYLDSSLPFHDAITALVAEIASFEKRRLIERINAGLRWARDNGTKSGKPIGRPKADLRGFTPEALAAMRAQGLSWARMQDATGIPSGTLRHAVALAKTLSGGK